MGLGDDRLRIRAKLLYALLMPLSHRIVRGWLFPVSACDAVSIALPAELTFNSGVRCGCSLSGRSLFAPDNGGTNR